MSGMWDHEEAGAFVETLFAKHHGEIYAYLLRMLREPELAADLTQDAFVKAYKNYETLEKPENARAWLYQIAHRVALDEIRRRKIIRFFPWTGESRGSAPSAEHLVMDAHLSGDMQRALARIPERQRAALLLAELHDLTGVELADALGVSHVAARALLTRARESLRQALAAERAAEAEADAARAAPTPRSVADEPHPAPPPTPHRHASPRTIALAPWPPSASTRRSSKRMPAWLEDHLAGCDACRVVATLYEADRLALRAMRDRTPEPPRDLWARTSAAIERESAARAGDRAAGATRRPRPALGVLSGVAVIAVVIGASVMSGGWLNAPTTVPAQPAERAHRPRQPDAGPARRRSRSVPVRSAGSARRPMGGWPITSPRSTRSVRSSASRTAPRSRTAIPGTSTSRSGRSRSRSRRSVTRRSSSGRTPRAATRCSSSRCRPPSPRQAPTPTPTKAPTPTPRHADGDPVEPSTEPSASTEPSSEASEPPASATPEPTARPTATPEPTVSRR